MACKRPGVRLPDAPSGTSTWSGARTRFETGECPRERHGVRVLGVPFGRVAQSVERFGDIEEVEGANPFTTTMAHSSM